LTLNRWFYHWADRSVSWAQWHDPHHLLEWARPGAVFVWDARFCGERVTGLGYAELRTRPGWQLVWSSDLTSPENLPYLACFERQGVLQAAKPVPDRDRD